MIDAQCKKHSFQFYFIFANPFVDNIVMFLMYKNKNMRAEQV